MKPKDIFVYNDETYVAVKAPSRTLLFGDKCELCDLCVNGRKVCLNHKCDCGTCMDEQIIFKQIGDNETVDGVDKTKQLKTQRDALKENNKELRQEVRRLAKLNEKLLEENAELHRKLDDIFIQCNKALREVFYKNRK